MTMVGADPDALEQAARELRTAAEKIDDQARTLPFALQAFSWVGRVATQFIDQMTMSHQPNLLSTADFLRHAADKLTRQAEQQRRASSVESMGSGSDASDRAPVQASPELVAGLRDVRHQDEAAQLRWWNSLTEAECAILLQTHPGELTALAGLPPNVLLQAQEAYWSQIADDVVVQTETSSGELGGSVGVGKLLGVALEGGFQVEQVTYADGSVALSLTADASLGVSALVLINGLRGGGGGGTYRFGSQAEADEFLRGLAEAVLPTTGYERFLMRQATVPGIGGGLSRAVLAADTLNDLKQYLQQFEGNLESAQVHTDGEASVGAATAAELSGGSKQSASIDGPAGDIGTVRTELSGSVGREVYTSFGGGSSEAEVSAMMSYKDGQPQTLSFEFAVEGSHVPLGSANTSLWRSEELLGGTAHFEFALTDERVAQLAPVITNYIKRGDIEGAMQRLASVSDSARIVYQLNTGAMDKHGLNAIVVYGGVESDTTTNMMTYVKPPYGDLFQVETP